MVLECGGRCVLCGYVVWYGGSGEINLNPISPALSMIACKTKIGVMPAVVIKYEKEKSGCFCGTVKLLAVQWRSDGGKAAWY